MLRCAAFIGLVKILRNVDFFDSLNLLINAKTIKFYNYSATHKRYQ